MLLPEANAPSTAFYLPTFLELIRQIITLGSWEQSQVVGKFENQVRSKGSTFPFLLVLHAVHFITKRDQMIRFPIPIKSFVAYSN